MDFLEVSSNGGLGDLGIHGILRVVAATTHALFRSEVERKLSNLVALLPVYGSGTALCHELTLS